MQMAGLEHFQKYCSHAEVKKGAAVFFGFWASFWLSHRVISNLLLRQSLAKTQKILAPRGYSISSNALSPG
jgi:hypothetical protein